MKHREHVLNFINDYMATTLRPEDVPEIENLDAKILAAIEDGGELDMTDWHRDYDYRDDEYIPCGTTHCRAGWAIMLAGERGIELELRFGSAIAGTLIYLASTGDCPNFFTHTNAAMRSIRAAAASGGK